MTITADRTIGTTAFYNEVEAVFDKAVTDGSPCPRCGLPLERQDYDGITVLSHGDPGCYVAIERPRWRLVPSLAAVLGHEHDPTAVRKVGRRYDVECLLCHWTASYLPEGTVPAFRQRAASHSETKAAVLLALADGQMLTAREIAAAAGLTYGQAFGAVVRLCKGRYITRSAERVLLVPQGQGYAFRLAARGAEWLGWYQQQEVLA